ncbi:hypothetical protein KYC5002_49340 [Archangium violaceum]|uniref:hypothetical protein n=1 Tax=Archangium violaceum TaxID=83451 RepID=UPI002B299C17|nr:hypothetical protein KYC5002_49340 [Archangium gephyra]
MQLALHTLILLLAAVPPPTTQEGHTPPAVEGPKEVLERYFSALGNNRLRDAWELLCSADQKARPLEQLQREEAVGIKSVKQRIPNIRVLKVSGDKALTLVEKLRPDPDQMMDELNKLFLDKRHELKDKLPGSVEFLNAMKELNERIARKVESGEIPLVNTREKVRLVREQGRWRVDHGFAWLAEVTRLREEAEALEAKGEHEAAARVRDAASRLEQERQDDAEDPPAMSMPRAPAASQDTPGNGQGARPQSPTGPSPLPRR